MTKPPKSNHIVHYQIFGKDTKPTIYYLTGYASKISWYGPHIRALVQAGFRVMAFDYDTAILDKGDPKLIAGSLEYIAGMINQDKSGREVAGVYGVSLGSWLGANMLVLCDIKSGMFNTGGAGMSKLLWENPWADAIKAELIRNAYTRRSTEKILGPYEFAHDGRRWQGKRALIMSTTGDEILRFDEVSSNVHAWQKAGDDIEWLVVKRLRHTPAIIRNLLRVQRTIRFFRES